MLRRYIAEQPISRLAVWARRTAVFSLIATILAIVIVRSGRLEFKPEGIARQAEFVAGRWVDHAVFSKLSTD